MPAALAVLAVTALTQIAGASHVRPKGATPLRASLVPAFKACSAPNRTHGAPLAFPSCHPPVQESNYLTVGTPDANGVQARSSGFLRLRVKATPPEDLFITLTITDVRCLPGTDAAVCGTINNFDGPDYTGQVQSDATLRISDHYNGPNLDEAATVQDIPFPVTAFCVSTADMTVGSTCSVSTSSQANCPPVCQNFDNQRSVIELGQVLVRDGGADGQIATADNTVFMRQGIFIP